MKERDYFWNNDYNLVNGVHTHGQRYDPFGPQNYPDEIQKTREMMALRDTLIHEVALGQKKEIVVDDSKTHELPPVPTNFRRPINYLDGAKAIESFTMMPGYKVELFASETEFPDMKNLSKCRSTIKAGSGSPSCPLTRTTFRVRRGPMTRS